MLSLLAGDLDALSLALEEAETARVDVPVKRRAAAQLRDLRRKLSRVQKKLRSGREPRRASSSPRRSSHSRSASPSAQVSYMFFFLCTAPIHVSLKRMPSLKAGAMQHSCNLDLTGKCMQSKEPEEHSATGSASELHGGAQQAGWPGPKENGVSLPNGIRDKVQARPAVSEKGQSPGPSRQLSSSFSLQSSLSEPTPGQVGSGQDGPAAANPSGRSKSSAAASAEVELQRDSASQVELAARAVEAREMEKERLRYGLQSLMFSTAGLDGPLTSFQVGQACA